jgi:hypothetical protein
VIVLPAHLLDHLARLGGRFITVKLDEEEELASVGQHRDPGPRVDRLEQRCDLW